MQELVENSEESEEDLIENLQFQKDQLETRSQASKQSKDDVHRHKPSTAPPNKKIKLTDQENKVKDILEGNPQLTKLTENCLRLSSLASDQSYDVTLDKEGCKCTCPAKQRWQKKKNCKHILAACILLGIRKDGMGQFLYAAERKSMAKCLSLYNGQIDEERKRLFLSKFMANKILKPGGQTKEKSVNKPKEDSAQSSKVKQPSKLNLDESISTYQEAKRILDEHGSEFRWTVDVNQSGKRSCPNHLPNEPNNVKKIAVGQRALVGEYLHIWMKKAGTPMIVREKKYFHDQCINDFKARTLHEDYVNLRPPKVIEIEDTVDRQFVEKFIKEIKVVHPLLTFKDTKGKELLIGQDGKLRKREPQPGLAELRETITDDGVLDIEESEDEYCPSSHSTTSDFSSPVKKKPKNQK